VLALVLALALALVLAHLALHRSSRACSSSRGVVEMGPVVDSPTSSIAGGGRVARESTRRAPGWWGELDGFVSH
jgi:hypothetical protein